MLASVAAERHIASRRLTLIVSIRMRSVTSSSFCRIAAAFVVALSFMATLSLSPVPLARQPADVAKPVAPKQTAAKPDVSKSDMAKPDTAKSDAAKSDAAKADGTRPAAKSSRNAKRAAREAATQPMQIVPDAKPAADPLSSARHAKRRKTARAKSRRSEPDLPRVLRKIFE